MKFTLIIPTYNEEDDIDILLISISKQTIIPHEIIFIDGDSKDKTIYKLRKYQKDKKRVYVFSDKRFDRNRARNYGIKKSTGDINLILNADVSFHENFIYHLKQFYEYYPNTECVLIDSIPIIKKNNRYSNFYKWNHQIEYSKDIYNKVDWTEGFSAKNKKKYFPIVKGLDLKGGEDSLFTKKIPNKSYFLSLKIEHKTPENISEFIKEKISRGRGNIHAHFFFLNKSITFIYIKIIAKLFLNLTLILKLKYFKKLYFYKNIDLFYLESLSISLGEISEAFNIKKYKNKRLLLK